MPRAALSQLGDDRLWDVLRGLATGQTDVRAPHDTNCWSRRGRSPRAVGVFGCPLTLPASSEAKPHREEGFLT